MYAPKLISGSELSPRDKALDLWQGQRAYNKSPALGQGHLKGTLPSMKILYNFEGKYALYRMPYIESTNTSL